MRRGLAALVVLLAACATQTVELDVSTSILTIETTTTTVAPTTTTTVAATTTTSESGPAPVVPETATVIPVRPVRLADSDGSRRARVEPHHVVDWLTAANDVFDTARIGFSYDPAEGMVELDDSPLNRVTGADDERWVDAVVRGNEVASEYPGELVVLFRRGPIDDETVEGLASSDYNFVMMGEWAEATACGAPDLGMLANQIGHYLALPATFSDTHPSTAEAAATLADAQQDPEVFDGDGFDDTPPDPGVYAEHRCSGEETVRIGGLDFVLPRVNIMSHYEERAELSLEQVDRLRWMYGVRSANDMGVPSNTPAAGSTEAEDALIATNGPCGLGSNESMDSWVGYQWVESDQLYFPSEEGCVLEFDIPLAEPGQYRVIALATRAPDHGAVELSVAGGSPVFEDLYTPVVMATGGLSLGNTTVDASSVRVMVEVVGNNARSSGSAVGIDGFLVRPSS